MRNITPPAPTPGQTYYVIVGCGVTAAVNYTTLVGATDGPFRGYEVLFIGLPEPWGEYNPLDMGQWPSILATPTFQRQLRSVPQNKFVGSAEFSTRIDDQWTYLYGQRHFHYSPGLVTSITPHKSHGFQVTYEEDGKTHRVHAAYLDICGGPGPSRLLCKNQVASAAWPYAYPGALLQTGESYLSSSTTIAERDERVAVIGGGPTAAWCVERALANGNRILWVSRETLNPAFVSSRRNDALAQTPLRRERRNRVTTVTYSVFPKSPNLEFAEFYDVSYVHHRGSHLEVDFTPLGRDRHVDSAGSPLPTLGQEPFALVVLALGQESGREEPCEHVPGCPLTREANSWATRLDPILSIAFRRDRHLILKNGMEVGLQSVDGKLRVLGGAFLMHPYANKVFGDINSELFRYVSSLTEQAQVNNGAAMATMTTALANNYFGSRPNYNRNSATLNQLKALPGLARQFAEFLHDVRTYRIHPVTNDEADEVHHSTNDRC